MNKKQIQIGFIALAVLISSTACAPKQTTGSTEVTVEPTTTTDISKEEPESTEDYKKLSNLYSSVLDNINSYKFTDSSEGENINYTYALVNMNESDTPELLVSENTEYGLSNVKIFSSNDDFTKEITSDEVLTTGVAGTGGFRGGLTQNESRNALIYTNFSSGTGDLTREEITSLVESDNLELKRTITWEGNINDSPVDKFFEIEFVDIANRKILETLASTPYGEYRDKIISENDDEVGETSLDNQIQAERDAGKMVVSGDVKVFNHNEMIDYQNLDPNMLPDIGETYVVLLLKDFVDVNMHLGADPGYRVRSVNIIGLPDDMATYDGQNITISFTADDGHWQTDVSLPMNAPRMHQVKVLK
ncbi:MAG: hypothetical protein Q4E02_04940 [Lagierella massiliensis]|nr:hypothetical protein [Lagierella massiliensis]